MGPTPAFVKFVSDFTLGFADGITVPFALTAGMSFLGRSDAIILAGLAELCAGSISMGISGFLAMRDTQEAAAEAAKSSSSSSSHNSRRERDGGDAEETNGMLAAEYDARRSEEQDERGGAGEDNDNEKVLSPVDREAVRRHLEPLQLPNSTITDVLAALQSQPTPGRDVTRRLRCFQDELAGRNSDMILEQHQQSPSTSSIMPPILSGISIALGYVIGGLIPLLPYFFAGSVATGTKWSVVLCTVVLFGFGAGKYWVLGAGSGNRSRRVRRCLWEGVQMLILGSVAAGAAMLCVRAVNQGALPQGGS